MSNIIEGVKMMKNKIIMALLALLVILPTTNAYADQHQIESDICAKKIVYLDEQDKGTIVCDDKFKKGTEFDLNLNIYTTYCDSTIEANIEYDPKYLEIESSEKSTYVSNIEKNDKIEQGKLNHKYTYNVCSSKYIPELENIKFKIINDDIDSTVIKVNGKENIINFDKSTEENLSTNEKDENNTGNDSQDKPITSEIIENNTTTSEEKESEVVPSTKLGLSVNDTLTILVITDIVLVILVLILIIGNINRKHNNK